MGNQAVYKALIESTASILQAVRFTSEANIIGISTSREWVDFIFDDILDKPFHIMEALETGKELTGTFIPESQSTETKLQLKEAIDAGKKTPGEDVPFIQAGENVDEAPIVNEESVENDDKSGAIDDHDPVAAT
ncbi:hypothetical protein Tco_1067251 [Tanacetum coccineum]|uniref:Uncharacterized protein n=1 Tax=Tanacetum coccineum TaxID=301880 RepID=A0ABQ5HD67_9ASTR